MAYFTQDDYRKIQQWLLRNSIKDTEFSEAETPFNGGETITIALGNQNRKVRLKTLIDLIYSLGSLDFQNVTDRYESPYITLQEAIQLIPSKTRKEGLMITFLNQEGNWQIYQFRGELNQWNIIDLWEDLFDFDNRIVNSILPDEEDLTKSPADEDGNSYLSLKDREYNPEDFSGLGRIILRKNIVEIEDPIYGKFKKNILTQDMINNENTIYEIRYDFDLNGKEIVIPEGCVLNFQGGSLSNGVLIGDSTSIVAGLTKIFHSDLSIQGGWDIAEAYVEWTGIYPNTNTDVTVNMQKFMDTFKCVKLNAGTYKVSTLVLSNPAELKGVGQNVSVINTSEGISIKDYNYINIHDIAFTGSPDLDCMIDVSNIMSVKLEKVVFFGYGNIGVRFDSTIQNYFNKLSSCRIVGFKKGIVFTHNSNANMLIDNEFYKCGTCIVIDGCNGIRIIGNTFQDFTSKAIKIEYNDYGTFPNGNLIIGNYFEGTLGIECDVDFSENENCSNNVLLGNKMTYVGKPHIKGMVSPNVIIDPTNATRNEVFLNLLGSFFKVDTFPSNYYTAYRGEQYIGCFNFSSEDEGNIVPIVGVKEEYNQKWKEILTKGINEHPVFDAMIINNNLQAKKISQYYAGGVLLGYDAPIEDRMITFATNKTPKFGYDGVWHYIQEVSSGYSTPTHMGAINGFAHFDKTYNSPCWWTGSNWVDAYGLPNKRKRGNVSQRPELTNADYGYSYFDSQMQKPIWWTGTKWVDATGTEV